jgi:hypothetical protein
MIMSIKSVSYDTILVIMSISKATKMLRLDVLFQCINSKNSFLHVGQTTPFFDKDNN